MTSLLAFAWRRAQSSCTTGSSTEGASLGDTILEHAVTASSSSDTLPNPMSSDTLCTEMSTSCLAGPSTPEALKRRKPPQQIRKELGLPPKQQQKQQQQQQQLYHWPEVEQEPKDRLPTRSSPASSIHSVLPPLSGLSSPPISTSSYHSRRSLEQNVARSPSLKVGEAKTAVGALLAMNDSRGASFPPLDQPQPERTSILPCRAWLLQEDRSLEEANDFSIELPYEALNESKGYCFSPTSSGRFRSVHHPNELDEDDDEDDDDDEQSSIHASPSSNRGRLARNLPNTSFTRGFLEAKDDDPYDFHPIVDKELIVVDDENPMNMSCMSQSTVKEMESLCSMGGDTTYQKLRSQEQKFRNQNERRIKEDLLLSTLERLQDDNEIVFEVMNRLKETQAKWELSMRPGGENLFWGFTEKRRLAILKAIDEQVSKWRSTPSDLIDSDLIESFAFCRSLVHASIPSDEKFMHVQGPNSAFTPQHGHRWKHMPGFRASLGFDEEPRSPQTIRGGDTSLFSLPSESGNDATPHTSNVSMTSTITSAVTPDNKANKRFGTMFAQGNLRESMETVCSAMDALSAECSSLIQTNLSTKSFANIQRIYYQLLSIPNDELKAVIDSFELDIVNLNISRMVSDDQGEEADAQRRIRSIEEPLPLVRSWGPVDTGGSQHVVSQTVNSSSFHPLEYHMLHSDDEDEDDDRNRENPDLYSPTTQDMQSLEPSPTRSLNTMDDDLRRTIGSFDTEDAIEEREGPPSMTHETNATRNKWAKGRLSIFNRRSLRKRQAAE